MNRSPAVVAGEEVGLDDDNVDDGPPGDAPPIPRRRLLPWQRLLLRGVLRILPVTWQMPPLDDGVDGAVLVVARRDGVEGAV